MQDSWIRFALSFVLLTNLQPSRCHLWPSVPRDVCPQVMFSESRECNQWCVKRPEIKSHLKRRPGSIVKCRGKKLIKVNHICHRLVQDTWLCFKAKKNRIEFCNFRTSNSVVYKFSCAGCSACYVGETNRHLATRVREHLTSDKNSHIFQHINGSEACRSLCSEDCFSILDTASTSFQLKIKEALHIGWEKPSLNKQVNHVNLTLSL